MRGRGQEGGEFLPPNSSETEKYWCVQLKPHEVSVFIFQNNVSDFLSVSEMSSFFSHCPSHWACLCLIDSGRRTELRFVDGVMRAK